MREKNQFLVEVGNKVREVRMSKGVTVRQLGELCKIDYAHLSRFENGTIGVRLVTLKLIADKLDADIKDFL